MTKPTGQEVSNSPAGYDSAGGYDRRLLVVAAAGIVIVALCLWRVANPRTAQVTTDMPQLRRPAPAFQLYDQQSTLVNLEAFLHRHQIVVVFYDGQAGPETNATLVELRKFHPALAAESIMVFGVSTALPQENRNNSSRPFPFPLLSDADAISPVSAHRKWGRFIKPKSLDKPPGTKPGVFVIDRAGLVPWDDSANAPQADDATSLIARLLGPSDH